METKSLYEYGTLMVADSAEAEDCVLSKDRDGAP